jgi:hypothetical protein
VVSGGEYPIKVNARGYSTVTFVLRIGEVSPRPLAGA